MEYVLDFLGKLREVAPAALERVQYIEQPTHRDLRANPENRMHAAAKIKPVVIDESLIDLESLLLARELGYSGVALKACKGHSEALLMGAAAQKYRLFLCVQDLTCVGRSFLHSASLAARVPTVAAIEGNGRQYCPAGNQGWEERFPGMFRITGELSKRVNWTERGWASDRLALAYATPRRTRGAELRRRLAPGPESAHRSDGNCGRSRRNRRKADPSAGGDRGPAIPTCFPPGPSHRLPQIARGRCAEPGPNRRDR